MWLRSYTVLHSPNLHSPSCRGSRPQPSPSICRSKQPERGPAHLETHPALARTPGTTRNRSAAATTVIQVLRTNVVAPLTAHTDPDSHYTLFRAQGSRALVRRADMRCWLPPRGSRKRDAGATTRRARRSNQTDRGGDAVTVTAALTRGTAERNYPNVLHLRSLPRETCLRHIQQSDQGEGYAPCSQDPLLT